MGPGVVRVRVGPVATGVVRVGPVAMGVVRVRVGPAAEVAD
ncbi:hypothetical protein BTZ20_0979 [Rhodococcus sp. MTM3W5.2]|nr:hypothetical protein BTZ20_0979 [Rhodococcus sp. MTM3W5.2]